ncbi:MBL fold metallo-hydrolase [Actinomyces sp. 2119]|uniref:MBL fold metallo-hydrolase n=1 Tax=Actinomyces sp. 2119 TaxID=2321393 RepID=UPI000E6D498E|nr:MBL fold metallo-hydrolase [Actinomyces sp. 2119]RJF41427.1 MBL fold metallo-hydrolase [Actinomyces sp. 2119]
MEFLHIRNATARLTYSGQVFLIDPMLSPKGSLDPFPSLRGSERNPLQDLPLPAKEVVRGIDATIVTHTHIDHWDQEAAHFVPKEIPVFVQNEYDADTISSAGFTDVRVLEGTARLGQVVLASVAGQHYDTPELVQPMIERTGSADTMGVVLSAEGEPTLYLTGDTVWFAGLEKALDVFAPDVVVANAGGNSIPGGRLVLDDAEVAQIHRAAPEARIVAVHMEALNHWGTSKERLRQTAAEQGFEGSLLIPDDGQSLVLHTR